MVPNDEFVKEITRRQNERKRKNFELKLALDRLHEHGMRSVKNSHRRRVKMC